MDRGAWGATVHEIAELDMTESTYHAHMQAYVIIKIHNQNSFIFLDQMVSLIAIHFYVA